MSELLLVGLGHRTSSLDLREKMHLKTDQLPAVLASLVALPHVEEALALSTCNRLEIYTAVRDIHAASVELRRWLQEMKNVPAELLDSALYEHSGTGAIRHLFRVTSSLDSMVVGEPQITGQVKEAYSHAAAAETVGPLLHRCLHRAFAVAKRVRSETSIGRRPVSISSVAVDLARHVFGELTRRRILLIGAGKMSRLAAQQLHEMGSELWVVNRSFERAIELGKELGAHPRSWTELAETLREVDIVLAATGSPTPVVTPEMVLSVMRARQFRPLVFLDIALPRDVDPRVGELENVYLFDLDALNKALAHNLAKRAREAQDAENLVDVEVTSFEQWVRAQSSVPTIKNLRDHFSAIARAEEQRLYRELPELGESERKAIRLAFDSLVNKLLHAPLTALKSGAGEPTDLVEATQKLFDLTAPAENASSPELRKPS